MFSPHRRFHFQKSNSFVILSSRKKATFVVVNRIMFISGRMSADTLKTFLCIWSVAGSAMAFWILQDSQNWSVTRWMVAGNEGLIQGHQDVKSRNRVRTRWRAMNDQIRCFWWVFDGFCTRGCKESKGLKPTVSNWIGDSYFIQSIHLFPHNLQYTTYAWMVPSRFAVHPHPI